MVLSRACDTYTAGIFSLAYANASLFMNIGKYGMRTYQASDIEDRNAFNSYFATRMITCAAMVLSALAYIAWAQQTLGYSADKTFVLILMIFFKLSDAFEDVYHGEYQRVFRLDVAGKALTARISSTLLLYLVCICMMSDLVMPTLFATLYTCVFVAVEVVVIKVKLHLPETDRRASLETVLALLKKCFPLFLASFLLFYIINAPKYSIDIYMSDFDQAVYGYIAMPVFIVSLLAGFVYNPMIASMATNWREGLAKRFKKTISRLLLIIAAISALCVLAAYLFGIPVLQFLFNCNLEGMRLDLCVLVLGGGFLSLAGLYGTGLTIMRKQLYMAYGYIGAAVVTFFVTPIAICGYGIDGASFSYLFCMIALSLIFAIEFYKFSHLV